MAYSKSAVILLNSLMPQIIELYQAGHSTTEIHNILHISRYSIRFRLFKLGLLRTQHEGILNARSKGIWPNLKGIKRKPFTLAHREKISKTKLLLAMKNAKGYSKKPNGYIELTNGENKGKGQHRIIMENHLGIKLTANECVHHRNGIRSDNRIENLEIMTRSEHMKFHRRKNAQ